MRYPAACRLPARPLTWLLLAGLALWSAVQAQSSDALLTAPPPLLAPVLPSTAGGTDASASKDTAEQPSDVTPPGEADAARASSSGAADVVVPAVPPLPTAPVQNPAPTSPVPAVPLPTVSTPSIAVPSAPAPSVPVAPVLGPPAPVPVPTPPVPSVVPAPVPAPPVATSVPNGVRGLWVDAFGPGLKTSQQVQQMVSDAQRLGVNTLFVQSIRRADCFCNKASVPRATDKDLAPNFDPLAEVLKAAHARGLRVFAWISVIGAGSASVPNTNPQHVLKTHGPTAGVNSWVNRRADGTYLEGNDIWLDAAIPQAAEYMTQSVLSIVKNYPVDGIQLDRIRYPDGGNWGYSPLTLARYRLESGAKGTPLPSDPAWSAWKREQITALVRRIALETRSLRPEVWMSAATITYGAPPTDLSGFETSRTNRDVLQDWPAWTRSGLLDLNVMMNYKRGTQTDQQAWFDGWNRFGLAVAGKGQVASGTAMYLNTPELTRAQVQRTLSAGLGWVGYAYRTPTAAVYQSGQSQAAGFEAVRQVLAESAAPLASYVIWNPSPPVRYAVLGRVVGSAQLGSRPVQAYGESGTLLQSTTTDANGYYGFADLPSGVVEVRVAGQRWKDRLARQGVTRYPDLLLREVKILPAMKAAGK